MNDDQERDKETVERKSTVLEGLPTPEHIAAITEKAMESNLQASDDLRAIGALAQRMAEVLNVHCTTAADDCIRRAGGISDTFKSFAQSVLDHGESVRALRERVERDRKLETDFYGLKPEQKDGGAPAIPRAALPPLPLPRAVTNGDRRQ